jgi:hypothetical protein
MRQLNRHLGCVACAVILIVAAGRAYAGNIDPGNQGDQYAWGENVGWINFKPGQGPGVTVTGIGLTGFAWGENIGWVNLSPDNGGVKNDGLGHLSGFAWGENVGWINFAPMDAGVTIGADGRFSGFAWGENIGWINFGITSGVRTSFTTEKPAPVLGIAGLLAMLAGLAIVGTRKARVHAPAPVG